MTTSERPSVIVAEQQASLLIDAIAAAQMCSMHRASWYKAVSSGKAPASVRIGGMVRWRKEELELWIAHGCPARAKWDTIYRECQQKV